MKVGYSVDLILVKVLRPIPTVKGLPLILGIVIYVTKDILVNVKISLLLDLLILLET